MKRWILLLAFAATALADYGGYGYDSYKPKKKSLKCYQCSYTPGSSQTKVIKVPRTEYKIVKIPRTVMETKRVSRLVKRSKQIPKMVTDTIDVSRLITEKRQVPRIMKRTVEMPRIVKEVRQIPRIVKDTMQVPVIEKRPIRVSRIVKQKVEGKSSGGYGYGYDSYKPKYQDVLIWEDKGFQTFKRYEERTKTRKVYDTEVKTKKVIDRKTMTEKVYDTVKTSRKVWEPKMVTRQVYETKVFTSVEYDNIMTTREVIETKQISQQFFDTQQVVEAKQGGWDKCKGPISRRGAKKYGIDVWDCHDNCYTRIEDNGNVVRGCYKGEFGVDPNQLGCSRQAGSMYCFCNTDKCNTGGVRPKMMQQPQKSY